MDKVLNKLAKQLNAFDEASLMAMWDTYAERVQNFEPTKRWEEACLVFGLIQSVRWKNQLFNHHWSESRNASLQGEHGDNADHAPDRKDDFHAPGDSKADWHDAADRLSSGGRRGGDSAKQPAKVLPFRPRKPDEPV